MRPIDAEALENYVAIVFAKFADTTPPIVADFITDAIRNAPTIETRDTDAETRGYIRGYNDAIGTTFKLMLQYGADRKEEEPEQ